MAYSVLAAVFLLSVGFAKIMAMCVNWMCAQRLAKKYVAADKSLNLALITAYPLLLLYGIGWQKWPSQLAPIWWLPVGIGAAGVAFLIGSTIRYWRYRPPACELSVVSELVDLRVSKGGQSWRDRLVGSHTRLRRVALLPGNEQFTIEISTKCYALPRLPASWDGLSIVHLSDFHFYGGVTREFFEAVCERAAALNPDLFVFSGDLLDDQQLLEWLPETLGRLRAPLGQYFVLGNHDWYLDPGAMRQELARLGWIDLCQRPVTLQRPVHGAASPIVLCEDESPWMGTHSDLAGTAADAFRILVSHTPDNVAWARDHRIDLMLAGHLHGGQIRLPILGPIYSPSRYGCRFSAGVFWLDPTLMYVSRGVSGKAPVRYNCPPEVTKLVLRCPG